MIIKIKLQLNDDKLLDSVIGVRSLAKEGCCFELRPAGGASASRPADAFGSSQT